MNRQTRGAQVYVTWDLITKLNWICKATNKAQSFKDVPLTPDSLACSILDEYINGRYPQLNELLDQRNELGEKAIETVQKIDAPDANVEPKGSG